MLIHAGRWAEARWLHLTRISLGEIRVKVILTGLKPVVRRKTGFYHFARSRFYRAPISVLSVGMSVLIGSGRPSTLNVISVPRPAFLDEPPNTSDGKKSLPQALMFRLPCLLAASVSSIVRDSIL